VNVAPGTTDGYVATDNPHGGKLRALILTPTRELALQVRGEGCVLHTAAVVIETVGDVSMVNSPC
jgi:superfamily II DNA/RNA helicase